MSSRRITRRAVGLLAFASLATLVATGASAAFAPSRAAASLSQGTQVQADPNRETFAYSMLDLDPEQTGVSPKQASLKYRTISWSAEAAKRMRQNADQRDNANKRMQLASQTELKLPLPASLNGRRLDAGTYRVYLTMNSAGAYEFAILLEGEEVRVPAEISESRQNFPYLNMSLVPSPERGFVLVFQWGTECGRVPFVVLEH